MSTVWNWFARGHQSQPVDDRMMASIDEGDEALRQDEEEQKALETTPPQAPPSESSTASLPDYDTSQRQKEAEKRKETPLYEIVGFSVVAMATIQTVADCQLGLVMAAPWIAGKVAIECGLVCYYGPEGDKPNTTKLVDQCFALPVIHQFAGAVISNVFVRMSVKKVTSIILSGDEAANLGEKLGRIAYVAWHALWPLQEKTDNRGSDLANRITKWSMKDVLRWISSLAFGAAVVAVSVQFGFAAAVAVHAVYNLAIFLLNEAATRCDYRDYAVLRHV